MLACDALGRCAFHDGDAHRCEIHRVLGHDALPLSCRQFPRVVVLTPAGVSVGLSHYCPTAAGLLFSEGAPVAIVEDAPAFPRDAEYEGLDARASLGPLLRPDALLLDLRLPGLGGMELLRLLAADTRLRRTPVVICSGASDLTRVYGPEIATLGCEVVRKPFELEDLIGSVRRAVWSGQTGW